MNGDLQVVRGIRISASGEATVDPALTDVLCDLAIQMEAATDLPVDVQHVVAALVLSARRGQLDSETTLSSDNDLLTGTLVVYVKQVFAQFGGELGGE